MLIVISPSKTLDFEKQITNQSYTLPDFVKEASVLIKPLRKLSVDQLVDLLGISPKLAQLNQERHFLWRPEFSPETARQALYAFRGDVYTCLLYTSDAADEEDSVDLGGRRIIKK